jgi:hypothetical protein
MSTPEAFPVLEEAAQAIVGATDKPPYVFELPVAEGRQAVDTTQDGEFLRTTLLDSTNGEQYR